MSTELAVLALTAAGLGFVHTALGPDHYLPFVLMGRAGRWSKAKLLGVTLLCGIGHVLASVAVGSVGIVLGWATTRMVAIQSVRGSVAAYALIGFGLVYSAWGLRRAARHRPHAHWHVHADGTVHAHQHVHQGDHLHVHAPPGKGRRQFLARSTPWVLFTIFVFGPCEPLIPLLLVPAAQKSTAGVLLVAGVFATSTLATMVGAVLVCQLGLDRLRLGGVERYSHALAGAALTLCGVGIQFLGF